MRILGMGGRVLLAAAAIVLAGSAVAETKVWVSLAGRDDRVRRPGIPGIDLSIVAPQKDDAAALTEELRRELTDLVHTRALGESEAGDFSLRVKVKEPVIDGRIASVAFEAVLVSAIGERVWHIEGRSDVKDDPLDAAVYVGIGRNVISALMHDGWLLQRYNPDDPPPSPPHVR